MPSPRMGGRRYQRAKSELKARGDIQTCWSCGKTLYANAPRGHPNSITLGHYRAREDGGAMYDPDNYGPQCPACNYSDGAHRTNAKRGHPTRPRTPSSMTNPDW